MAANIPAIDEDSLPYVMPTTVPRVTADGRPTTHLINWEEKTRNWYLTNAVALDTRITEVRAEADGNLASYKEEINAVIGPDGSLVEKVETVEARANSATATGQIYFAAQAGPSGSVAAYGLYLSAGNAYTGLEAIAMSDDTSAIGFTASKFVFTDSGTAKQVFTYTGGKFVLTGDVSINGNLVVNGTISTDKVTDNAITNIATGEGDSSGASCPIYARAGDRILATVTYSPNQQIANTSSTSASPAIRLNGSTSTQKIMRIFRFLRSQVIANDGTVSNPEYYWSPTTRQVLFIAPSTGTHTITAAGIGGPDEIEIFISAVAYSK